MEIIYYQKGQKVIENFTGIGLGNFDGLHIGHMALINTVIKESKLNSLDSVVYTFTKHPENILRKSLFTPLITTESKKMELLGETSLNHLYFDEFDEEFSRMSPEVFVREVLVGRLKMKLAVAGFDYKFGYKGQGDIDLLKELGKKYLFKTIVIPPIKINNEVVSSTKIRQHITKGDMDQVFKLLGRHYSITAEVISGRRVGNTIGFPTANINPENYLILPQKGVYITRTQLKEKLYCSMTNIGYNPTFENQDTLSVETHIIDFEGDIYGDKIEVFFLKKLRNEKKFSSVGELVNQIKIDMQKVREFLNLNGSC
jgi:riboflavin kinase / FMN adenylyltransferase